VPYGANVVINVISEFYGNKRNTVYYSLNQSIPTPLLNQKIILNNLSSGKYQISIYDNTGIEMMELANFSFSVKMPWFASFWMILLYMIFLIFLLYLYYRWNKVRFKEKFKLKEEELKHANKLRQMELEAKNLLKIQEYEKHILENQVQMKANELAGKSLSLAKQTELIESIQAIIETENNTQSLKSKIQKAVKINKLNKNEWKSFETNLLKSNEDFVKNLTHKYPTLTSKDLKLCIYLKMNLASKEIAPLMNISYRGVELHRYRLRKKLKIGQDENLNSFMNNI
jgi:DNA-binding NarL/FixJ family response regulator